MADIDMTDAPSGSGSAQVKKALGKSKATPGEGASDGKKRFEVKKVGHNSFWCFYEELDCLHERIVERRGSMGMGYRCRQLCYLQKPYYGSL
jgi:hypothetical protein